MIPNHLRKYIVEQNYERYTAVDQAVWRFIMRQLKNYLAQNAHPIYTQGLEKTGISTESIPKISEMSEKLKPYGWEAVAVSGFIPPAAFMEMQSLGLLPIASDMRSIEHLAYTPAPDIIHEAAGHAPILIDPEFSAYLKKYAQVARKSILDVRDLEIYESIRELSDLKEDPLTPEEKIKSSYERLGKAKENAGEPSEAALLARMNWWTAEYGLVGDLDQPKIYGAGLMSSVGESRSCLQKDTRKIPFSLECLNYNYDITEMQPQVFVAKSFQELSRAIEALAETMAYQKGGRESLDKIIRARTVNTVQFDSGLQISGQCVRYQVSYVPTDSGIAFLKFDGPCQLSYGDKQLSVDGVVHDRSRHAHGFSSPIGTWKNVCKNPTTLTLQDLKAAGIEKGKFTTIETTAGVFVSGTVTSIVHQKQALIMITFTGCTVRFGVDILFQPEWGDYDMAVGTHIPSVFGGAADPEKFGATDTFNVTHVPHKTVNATSRALNEIYSSLRNLREQILEQKIDAGFVQTEIRKLQTGLTKEFPNEWLAKLELIEIMYASEIHQPLSAELAALKAELEKFADNNESYRSSIYDGLKIASCIQVGT